MRNEFKVSHISTFKTLIFMNYALYVEPTIILSTDNTLLLYLAHLQDSYTSQKHERLRRKYVFVSRKI